MKKKDVLLVIGMQVDMLPGGALEVPGGAELIPIINDLMGEFEEVIAANFCLPPGHLSFAGNHPLRAMVTGVEWVDRFVGAN